MYGLLLLSMLLLRLNTVNGLPTMPLVPTATPTESPAPSPSPSETPTESPAPTITNYPTENQPDLPSEEPTESPAPSPSPSHTPTEQPSLPPTLEPSSFPSMKASKGPTKRPSLFPSFLPTNEPTTSTEPSRLPSIEPSNSMLPTEIPSTLPSSIPTSSSSPSTINSAIPTSLLSMDPTVGLRRHYADSSIVLSELSGNMTESTTALFETVALRFLIDLFPPVQGFSIDFFYVQVTNITYFDYDDNLRLQEGAMERSINVAFRVAGDILPGDPNDFAFQWVVESFFSVHFDEFMAKLQEASDFFVPKQMEGVDTDSKEDAAESKFSTLLVVAGATSAAFVLFVLGSLVARAKRRKDSTNERRFGSLPLYGSEDFPSWNSDNDEKCQRTGGALYQLSSGTLSTFSTEPCSKDRYDTAGEERETFGKGANSSFLSSFSGGTGLVGANISLFSSLSGGSQWETVDKFKPSRTSTPRVSSRPTRKQTSFRPSRRSKIDSKVDFDGHIPSSGSMKILADLATDSQEINKFEPSSTSKRRVSSLPKVKRTSFRPTQRSKSDSRGNFDSHIPSCGSMKILTDLANFEDGLSAIKTPCVNNSHLEDHEEYLLPRVNGKAKIKSLRSKKRTIESRQDVRQGRKDDKAIKVTGKQPKRSRSNNKHKKPVYTEVERHHRYRVTPPAGLHGGSDQMPGIIHFEPEEIRSLDDSTITPREERTQTRDPPERAFKVDADRQMRKASKAQGKKKLKTPAKSSRTKDPPASRSKGRQVWK